MIKTNIENQYMKNSAYSLLSKICLGATLLGGLGSVIEINKLDESNTQEMNNYIIIGSVSMVYISFGLGITSLYLRRDGYR